MLLCKNNAYYPGYTHDLEKRYLSRLDGCKSIKIAQAWEIQGGKSRAMQLERYIKKFISIQEG